MREKSRAPDRLHFSPRIAGPLLHEKFPHSPAGPFCHKMARQNDRPAGAAIRAIIMVFEVRSNGGWNKNEAAEAASATLLRVGLSPTTNFHNHPLCTIDAHRTHGLVSRGRNEQNRSYYI
jgi:hypothetical protein